MDARTFDKSKLPSRHVTEGPSRAPHRSYYYAMGLTEEQIHRPFVGVVSCWNEAAPCNIALMRQAQSAKKGVERGRRHAARVLHHHRDRRHRHGPPGHEVVARLARGDRRFDRAHHARPLLRRHGRPRRLRQVAARRDDGDAAPQRAGGVHVRRLDPARQVQGQGRDGGRRVRGRRPALRRQDVGRGPARARVRRLSGRRRLRRPVHRQHHGDGVGGDRAGAAGVGGRAGALREPRRVRAGERQGGDAPAGRRHPPARHRHPQGLRERGDHRCGDRRLDQRRPASAGHGARVRHRVRPDGRRAPSSSARPTSPT